MDLIPTKKRSNSDDGLGRGMEFAILVLMFLGVGYVLDRWLGTKPLFMIALVVLALVGQFASMWYSYDARMKEHETERLANQRKGPKQRESGASVS
jgi:F0F1-type ATP synthase assembly protein I